MILGVTQKYELRVSFKVFKGLGPFTFTEAFPVRQQSQYNMKNYSYFAMPRAEKVLNRKFVFHRFKIAGQYTIPYERDRLY